jgi:hypothetical protein
MNLLQVLCIVGIKGLNVPKMLNRFIIEDEEVAKAFATLKEKYWDILISMFTTSGYDDMVDGYDYGETNFSNEVLAIIDEHLAEEDKESETDQVGECMTLLTTILEHYVHSIEFDGENVIAR